MGTSIHGALDGRWGERPVAFVVREPEVSDEELTAHLASRFPKFWLPDKFVTMTQIPVTSVGKFDKKRLRYLIPE